MCRTIHLRLPPSAGAPAEGRHGLETLRPFLPDSALEDLFLLVTELVTNSVRHARLDARSHITIVVQIDGDRVRAEVADHGLGFPAREGLRPASAIDPCSGWGLVLLAQVASRWGMSPRNPTVVWFELDLDHDRRARGVMRVEEPSGV